jgi:aminoglycoside 3-N-acetyltransferase
MENLLADYWEGSGLEKGDTVLLHSSMKRLLDYLTSNQVIDPPKKIIDSLISYLGIKGTLILPLFNFDFPKSKFFSMRSTPSQMGTITEYARRYVPGVRTGHPIYSFFITGYNQNEFDKIDNISGYGIDSPFAKLISLEGKIAAVDLEDSRCMTMYHHVEEMCKVPYRYFKEFEGEYESINGSIEFKKYLLFVRDLDRGVVTNVDRMGEILWKENLCKGNRPRIGNGMRTILARTLFDRTKKEILHGRAIDTLYSIYK